MTKSLPLSSFRVQIESLCANPQELIVTEEGQPVFTLLPYEMYQSLIETLDIVADGDALGTLQENLSELKAGKPVKVHHLKQCKGPYQVGLTDTAYKILHGLDEGSIQELTHSMKSLSSHPEKQGKALVGSLKGYRSIKAQEGHYQVIYFIENKQVVIVFVHAAVVQPNALLFHLLKNT